MKDLYKTILWKLSNTYHISIKLNKMKIYHLKRYICLYVRNIQHDKKKWNILLNLEPL